MTYDTSEPSFSFAYSHGNKHVNISFEAETWPEALEEFVSLITAAYGYSIKEQVAIKESPFRVNAAVWSGPVFNEEML